MNEALPKDSFLLIPKECFAFILKPYKKYCEYSLFREEKNNHCCIEPNLFHNHILNVFLQKSKYHLQTTQDKPGLSIKMFGVPASLAGGPKGLPTQIVYLVSGKKIKQNCNVYT